MTTNQFSSHTLANGLQVLIKEMHHAPVASFWVWYLSLIHISEPTRPY